MDEYWNYTVEAYGDCVTVRRNIDNTISRVYVDVDAYATRDWTEDEVNDGKPRGDVDWMQEEEPQFTEYGEGTHAELKFEVEDGVASFVGVDPDGWDGDSYNFPTWLRLLAPARRMVQNVPGVETCEDPREDVLDEMDIGDEMVVKGLADG